MSVAKVLDELERKRKEATHREWSVDALRSLLRYGRKNEGPWDEIEPDKEIPNDDHAGLIIDGDHALDALIEIARAAHDFVWSGASHGAIDPEEARKRLNAALDRLAAKGRQP